MVYRDKKYSTYHLLPAKKTQKKERFSTFPYIKSALQYVPSVWLSVDNRSITIAYWDVQEPLNNCPLDAVAHSGTLDTSRSQRFFLMPINNVNHVFRNLTRGVHMVWCDPNVPSLLNITKNFVTFSIFVATRNLLVYNCGLNRQQIIWNYFRKRGKLVFQTS